MEHPAKILVSACLLGQPVRYDGSTKTLAHTHLERWQKEGRIIALCPERAAGLPTPRPAAEIADRENGLAVLEGKGRVMDNTGADVTAAFVAGAQAALALAQANQCQFALLIDGSPSCGSLSVYDGSFTGHKHAGEGVTAALLRQHGVEVFAHTDIDALHTRLQASTLSGTEGP